MEELWTGNNGFWKDKIRALHLRIRDRFHVAVDRHWHRGRFSDASSSSAMHRWMFRLRKLCDDSSSHPFTVSRERGGVTNNMEVADEVPILQVLQALTVPIIGNLCHVFMHGLNQVQTYGVENLHRALFQRAEGKSLITVSNHVASMDDPLVIASLLPPSVLWDAHSLRWTLCASDHCFKNPMMSAFFRCLKVLPVTRGEGVYQKGMDMAISKLNNGGWVHIFPEGRRSRDGGKTLGFAKRGVGRLVMDVDNIPIVVPFVHSGMQEVMPIGSIFPKIGKRVTILVGEPICFDDLVHVANSECHFSRDSLYDAISSRIGQRLHELKIQVDKLALEEFVQDRQLAMLGGERARLIFQLVDWDGFGTGSYIFSRDESSLVMQDIQPQPKLQTDQSLSHGDSDWNLSMNFSCEGRTISKIHSYMNPNELMGFAARGLFTNSMTRTRYEGNFCKVGPSKIWKQFLEACSSSGTARDLHGLLYI